MCFCWDGIFKQDQWKLVRVITGSFEFKKEASYAKAVDPCGDFLFFRIKFFHFN